MNTGTVRPRTVWAVLAMETGLVLPLISLPTQGDRVYGVAGPLMLVLLLPLGYVALRAIPALRDPSWRLLIGIGLALLTRAIVSQVPESSLAGLAIWLARSIVPTVIGVALWWRGGALCVTELTPADIRTEFSVVAVCMLGTLALVRPFVLPDQLLLGGSVALVVVGGLLATALSRQDAAEVASLRFGRTLATTTALLPAGAAVVLVAALRPDLLGVMWWTLARIVELALTPLGLLLTWLASLFPPATRGFEALPPRPLPDLAPDLAALGELHDQTAWIGMAIALALILVAGVATLIVVRLLLASHIRAPVAGPLKRGPELTVERSGNPRGDVADFWAWLLRLLGRRLVREHRSGASHGAATSEAEGVDAWAVYRGLLSWAEQRGHGRRPSETTGQLQARLVRHVPESIEAVDLVTRTYEGDRYGGLHPSLDHLRRLRQALATLRR